MSFLCKQNPYIFSPVDELTILKTIFYKQNPYIFSPVDELTILKTIFCKQNPYIFSLVDELTILKTIIIKVGMGPGSICTTRVISGVGVPQVNAIIDCAKALEKRKKSLVADGGLKHSGDLTKAIALGAQAVMVGNILAGSEESPGEMVLYRGRAYKAYRGMGSLGAMKKGSKGRYRQEDIFISDKMVPEGVEGRVPYKGSASSILYQMTGGLKSGMGYIGAKNINDFKEKARFIKISSKSFAESQN